MKFIAEKKNAYNGFIISQPNYEKIPKAEVYSLQTVINFIFVQNSRYYTYTLINI